LTTSKPKLFCIISNSGILNVPFPLSIDFVNCSKFLTSKIFEMSIILFSPEELLTALIFVLPNIKKSKSKLRVVIFEILKKSIFLFKSLSDK